MWIRRGRSPHTRAGEGGGLGYKVRRDARAGMVGQPPRGDGGAVRRLRAANLNRAFTEARAGDQPQSISSASGRSTYHGANHATVGNHIHARVVGNTRVNAGSDSRNARKTPVEIRPADA